MTLTRPGAAQTPSGAPPNVPANAVRAPATASSSLVTRRPRRSWLGSGLPPLLGRCPPQAGGAPSLWRCSLGSHLHVTQLLGHVLRVRVGDERPHPGLRAGQVLQLARRAAEREQLQVQPPVLAPVVDRPL